MRRSLPSATRGLASIRSRASSRHSCCLMKRLAWRQLALGFARGSIDTSIRASPPPYAATVVDRRAYGGGSGRPFGLRNSQGFHRDEITGDRWPARCETTGRVLPRVYRELSVDGCLNLRWRRRFLGDAGVS
jgi:hypothetical protein